MESYNPRDYQKRMTDFLVERPEAGLFVEMGLGKTVTTLTAIKELMFNRYQVGRVLILAPLRVALLTWPEEIKKWDHLGELTYSVVYGEERAKKLKANVDIHIMSYSTLPWLVRYLKKRKRLPHKFDMVIFDESTYIKNQDSIRWTICNALFYDIPRRVILTGTPSPNGLHDLWGQIFHLDRGKSLGASLGNFRRLYFLRDGHRYLPLRNAREKMSKQLADLVISMKAKDYLQLPGFITNKVLCKMDDKSRAQYEELEREFFVDIKEVETSAFDAASLTMKLRQFCQGFLYNDEGGVSRIHNEKLQALVDIRESTDDNLLVAVQFHEDIERIKCEWPDVACIWSGSDTKEDLINIGRWNRGELPMLVAHPGSLAHGMNLQTGGHTIVWYGVTWSLEHHDQFNARLYRQGQTKRVIAHYILMHDTIDQVVMAALRRKTRTQADLMEGIKQYRKEKTG